MQITNLRLQNFRNFADFNLDNIESNLNVIAAPNGSGKSNFLEAIFLLATGFSARTNKIKESIAWDQTLARVAATIDSHELAVVVNSTGKKFFVGEKTVEFPQFLPHLNAVIFQPSDLNLLNGSPLLRRLYLNRLLAQLDFEYLHNLMEHRKLLKKRNRILRDTHLSTSSHNNRTDSPILDAIEEQLTAHSTHIYRKRHAVIVRLNSILTSTETKIEYIPSPQSLHVFMQELPDTDAVIDAGINEGKMREFLR